MATRTFISLESKIAPSAPGCPVPTILQFVREAAIEVCERTWVWRYEQDPIRLTAGIYEYDYETPSNAEVVGVVHSALNNEPFPVRTQEQIHSLYADWPSTDSTKRSQPRFCGQFDPDHFVVAPVPDDATTYDVKMFLALRPTPDATSMDKTAFDEVEMLIMHGALQHLLVLPNKSWTDRELATYHARQYTYKISSKRAKTNLGVGRGQVHVRANPLA